MWRHLKLRGGEHDGASIPATTLRVKSSVDVKGGIMVELDERMLCYIKYAMLNSVSGKRERLPRESNGWSVRWRRQRQVWVAVRGKTPKSFRPTKKAMPPQSKKLQTSQLHVLRITTTLIQLNQPHQLHCMERSHKQVIWVREPLWVRG